MSNSHPSALDNSPFHAHPSHAVTQPLEHSDQPHGRAPAWRAHSVRPRANDTNLHTQRSEERARRDADSTVGERATAHAGRRAAAATNAACSSAATRPRLSRQRQHRHAGAAKGDAYARTGCARTTRCSRVRRRPTRRGVLPPPADSGGAPVPRPLANDHASAPGGACDATVGRRLLGLSGVRRVPAGPRAPAPRRRGGRRGPFGGARAARCRGVEVFWLARLDRVHTSKYSSSQVSKYPYVL